jgi:transcriptional regulator with GAF, ATPase, and Fis domain/predicted negative regulator of RcsB-dependent stress response
MRSDLGDTPRADLRHARIQALQGKMTDALPLLEQIDLSALPDEEAVLALQLRGGVQHSMGQPEQALTDLREALRRSGERLSTRTMTLLERIGFIEHDLGHFDRAVRQYERAAAMARQLGHEALLWSPTYNIGRSVRDKGERRRGLAIQEQAAALAEDAGNLFGVATVLNSLGSGWITLGRTDKARHCLDRALQIARRIDNRVIEAMVQNNSGHALAMDGRLDDAEIAFEESLSIRRELRDDRGRIVVHITRGEQRLRRGRRDEAFDDLAAVRRLLADVSAPLLLVDADLLAARAALWDDDRDAARAAAETARAGAVEHQLEQETVVAQGLAAQVGAGDLSCLDQESLERGPWLAEALFTRAGLAAAGGRQADADADLERGLTILGETPDCWVELGGLLCRLGLDISRLEGTLGTADPDIILAGESLARVKHDLDRARGLSPAFGSERSQAELERLTERLDVMDHTDDGSRLTTLAGRMRDLERLVEINKLLTSERDTQRLLDQIMDSAVELTGAARGFLILMEGRSEEFRAARNIDESDIAEPQFQISHSVAREVVRSGEPLLTANAIDDERLTSAASISELKLLSILCVPLRHNQRVRGAIYIDHPQVVGRFTKMHLETTTRLAEQAAIALENARLSEGLEASNKELLSKREEVARLNEVLQQRLERREAELQETRESLDASRQALGLRYDYSNIVSRSPRMHEVFDLLDRVTDSDVPVVIHGESGTGKELLATAIHYNGSRKDKNFLSINCAAIPEQLIESELFGSVKGAFTGADRDRKGLFAQAHGGTLFLDEIGDMSLAVQSRLLRVLQEGEFLAVGGRELQKVDVRILSATHRRMSEMVADGVFREDLFFRLAVAQIELPALRERTEDISVLLPHLLERHGDQGRTIEPEALALLEAQPWPGNVRELENFVRVLLLFERDSPTLSAAVVTRVLGRNQITELVEPVVAPAGSGASLKARMEAFERAEIQGALERSQGNKAAAARDLGVTVRGFYKMLERLGL